MSLYLSFWQGLERRRGGKLEIDSSGAVPRVSPLGESVLFQGATLLTNIDNNDLDRGLKNACAVCRVRPTHFTYVLQITSVSGL